MPSARDALAMLPFERSIAATISLLLALEQALGQGPAGVAGGGRVGGDRRVVARRVGLLGAPAEVEVLGAERAAAWPGSSRAR